MADVTFDSERQTNNLSTAQTGSMIGEETYALIAASITLISSADADSNEKQ